MSNEQIRMGGFNILPKGVKNLLIINFLLYFATFVFKSTDLCDLNKWLGLHYFTAKDFYPWQIITYMFMHANFGHIFFNMFALWMFGATIENYWGTKKFLIYYLVAGIGSAITHYLITYYQIYPTMTLINGFLESPSVETYQYLVEHNEAVGLSNALSHNLEILKHYPNSINEVVSATISLQAEYINSFNLIGASGAVYGLLLAFGVLFPNSLIYIYFLFPIKAKWFVLIFGALELVYGVLGTADGVAHFAHLGGMIFGLILILLWRKNEKKQQNYYQNY